MMCKNLMRYAAILVFFMAGTISIIEIGTSLHADHDVSEKAKPPSSSASNTLSKKAEVSASGGIGHELRNNLRHPVSILLLQVIVVLTAYALFISVAMSITAFPVLARIIEERGLSCSLR
jgi:hypothetical protein